MQRNLKTLLTCGSVLALLTGCYGEETYPGPPGTPIPSFDGTRILAPNGQGDPIPAPPERLTPQPTNDQTPLAPQYLHFREGGMFYLPGSAFLDSQLHSDFTLELWLRVESTINQEILRANGLKIGVRSGYLRVGVAQRELFGIKIADNEWYHASLVVHDQQIRFYVNGHLCDTLKPNGSWLRPTSPFIIGQNGGPMDREGNFFFVGAVDNLRLIHHAIHSKDFVPEQHFRDNDLLSFGFSFDGQSDTVIFDQSSNGFYANLRGPVAIVPGAI